MVAIVSFRALRRDFDLPCFEPGSGSLQVAMRTWRSVLQPTVSGCFGRVDQGASRFSRDDLWCGLRAKNRKKVKFG